MVDVDDIHVMILNDIGIGANMVIDQGCSL